MGADRSSGQATGQADGREAEPARARGRPRLAATDEAILRATLVRLGTDGYARMSVEAIAADAGVTKPTVYRRWASKADLATAALAAYQAESLPAPTGETRADLRAGLRAFGGALLRPLGMAMIGALLVEEARTPELLRLFRERIVRPRREALRSVLEEAAARGELRPGADLEAAVNLMVGAFYARYLTGEGVPEDWAERVEAAVWGGIGRG